jgi:hypothetical protein
MLDAHFPRLSGESAMRKCLVPIAFALASTGALADPLQPVTSASTALAARTAESGHMARLYQRYCDKLKEGPEAYALFVKRMYTVTGFTFTEFAPTSQYDTVRYPCRN